MRKFLFFFLFAPFFLSAQSNVSWNPPLTVNSNDSLGFVRPKIVVTQSNNIVVMWGKTFDKEVYVSANTGNGFNTPQKVTPDNMTAFVQFWGGPSMAAAGDTVFIAFKAQPEDSGVVYLVRSIDGGVSFNDTVRVSNDNWSRFAEVSVRPGGHPAVTYMQMDPGFHDPRYVVVNSTDGGNSFSNPKDGTLTAPGEVCDCCPGFLLAQKQRTLLMFRNNDNDLRDIWASVSTDGGQSFPLGADVDNNNWMINSCPATGPHAIIDNDSIYYVWMSGASGNARVNIGSADINTLNTGINTEISAPSFNAQNYPKIAGEGNIMGVVWQETRGSSTNILFLSSTTGVQGLIGGIPDTVNINQIGTRGNPDLVYKNGTFYVVWQDNITKSVILRSAQTPFASLNDKNETFLLFPNPAEDYVILKSSLTLLKSEIQLFDHIGNRIYLPMDSEDTLWKLDVSSLSRGIYFLNLNSGNKTISKTLMLK